MYFPSSSRAPRARVAVSRSRAVARALCGCVARACRARVFGVRARTLRTMIQTPQVPQSQEEFARLVDNLAYQNQSLLDYFLYDKIDPTPAAVRKNYWRYTAKCIHSENCWCFHVIGSRDKSINPHPERCEAGAFVPMMQRKLTMTREACHTGRVSRAKCPCITGSGRPCLHTQMNAGTMIATIALARAAGVNHIVEEGREGGLTAFMYRLHGFKVTSIEYGPTDEVTKAMRAMAPDIVLADGDGSKLIPELIAKMTPQEAARTMVFFDGEKRVFAYQTYSKVKDKVALAAFDDSIPAFQQWLDSRKEVWWQAAAEPLYLARMGALINASNAKLDAVSTRMGGHSTCRPGGAYKESSLCPKHSPADTLFLIGGGWGKVAL